MSSKFFFAFMGSSSITGQLIVDKQLSPRWWVRSIYGAFSSGIFLFLVWDGVVQDDAFCKVSNLLEPSIGVLVRRCV